MKCQRCENGNALYEETDKVLGEVHKCTSCGWRHYENDLGKPKSKPREIQKVEPEEIQKAEPASKKYDFVQIRKYDSKPAFITIWKSGRLCLNAAAMIKYNPEKLDHILLFYDNQQKTFGLRFSEKTKDAFPLIKHITNEDERKVIETRAFFKHSEIIIEKPMKMPLEHNKDYNLLVFELLPAITGKCPKCNRILANKSPFCNGSWCNKPKP